MTRARSMRSASDSAGLQQRLRNVAAPGQSRDGEITRREKIVHAANRVAENQSGRWFHFDPKSQITRDASRKSDYPNQLDLRVAAVSRAGRRPVDDVDDRIVFRACSGGCDFAAQGLGYPSARNVLGRHGVGEAFLA